MEGIGDLATLWRIKGSSSITLCQAKSCGLLCVYLMSNVPPCGNLYLNCLHWKLLAPLHVLVLYLACVLIWYASDVLILSNQACVCWFAYHEGVCLVLSLLLPSLYLSRLLWEINGSSHFGGAMCLGHLIILKWNVHEKYHLVLFYIKFI